MSLYTKNVIARGRTGFAAVCNASNCGALVSALSAFALLLITQNPADAASTTSPVRGMHAYLLNEAPEIDGVILDDAVWSAASPASGFRQSRPDEGQPASQKTEVFIGYTEVALYIGVVAYDDDPAGIIVADSRRDTALDDMDSFKVIIDSFHDRQNGFVFGTNAAGVQYDGQVTKEADYSAGGTFNLNWDTSWKASGRISELGWSAEIEIPWQSLRYGAGQEQTWGINFQRNIGRNNEVVYWSPIPRQYNLYRISKGGTLDGLRLTPHKNLKLTPYLLTTASRGGELPAGTKANSEFGFDLKYSLTPGLTFDATYNTDFAQVEVDEQKVNLGRFSVFLPEKRPFFLENAGEFVVGNIQDVDLFFSRRIGIAENGTQIPIDGGVRLTGRIGAATNIGFLRMRSAAVGDIAPANDYTVARVRQKLPSHSSIGALLVSRDGDGSLIMNAAEDYNQTYAIDGSWGISDQLSLDGWMAQTDTPGLSGRDEAFALKSTYNSLKWLARLDYTEVGADFNPEVGFLARSDYRRGQGHLLRVFRPDNAYGLYEIRPHISYSGYWNFAGFHESGLLRYDIHAEWRNGMQFRTGVHYAHEGVLESFDIANGVTIEPGVYDDKEVEFRVITNQSAPFSADIATRVGGFFGGDRIHISPALQYRFADKFSSELAIDFNDIKLPMPNGDFNLTLTRLRLSYSFTPRITLQALLQYNSRSRVIASNLRFSWLESANSGLYVVYNELRDDRFATSVPGRELMIKYSKIFDLLR